MDFAGAVPLGGAVLEGVLAGALEPALVAVAAADVDEAAPLTRELEAKSPVTLGGIRVRRSSGLRQHHAEELRRAGRLAALGADAVDEGRKTPTLTAGYPGNVAQDGGAGDPEARFPPQAAPGAGAVE